MRKVLVAAGAALLALAPHTAAAYVYAQGTVVLTGNPDDLSVWSGAAFPRGPTVHLSVVGAELVHAWWAVDIQWQELWWDWYDGRPYYLDGNEYALADEVSDNGAIISHDTPEFVAISTLTPSMATFYDHDGTRYFNDCGRPYKYGWANCAVNRFGRPSQSLGGFQVTTDQPSFSWKLYGAIPEPGTLALVVAGAGLAGAALRRRRTREAA